MKPHRLFVLLGFALLAACGPSGSTSPRRDLPDAAVAVPDLFSGCKGGAKCPAEAPLCDPKTGLCVACLADDGCPAAKVCAGGRCVPGCTGGHPCGDGGGSCDLDGGVCRTCAVDPDCTDAQRPRCEVATGSCVACLPAMDNCPPGSFCAKTNGAWTCASRRNRHARNSGRT